MRSSTAPYVTFAASTANFPPAGEETYRAQPSLSFKGHSVRMRVVAPGKAATR